MTAVPPRQESDVWWLLSDLNERVPHVRSTVLLSSDGLPKATCGLNQTDSEQLSAIASGLFSLARGSAAKFDSGETVRQIVIEHDETLLFISWAGFGSVLAVLADRRADAGVLGYEMNQLIKSVQPFLSTPARSTPLADNYDG